MTLRSSPATGCPFTPSFAPDSIPRWFSRRGVRAAALIAASAAVFTVHFLTRYLRTPTLKPFGVYCILLGAVMTLANL
ncbi:MAG TPA: hypothetical protein VMV16_01700 [Solirubrobacteraceae bacterium]|nr:hypothetical protein [Solirubrobacteraceae bacterium]